ncbi:MAG: hypothetical protein KKF43_01080 [Proteobacteria bacterium]|nr:hypothetical protein [Pseudomonadota bacterium]
MIAIIFPGKVIIVENGKLCGTKQNFLMLFEKTFQKRLMSISGRVWG